MKQLMKVKVVKGQDEPYANVVTDESKENPSLLVLPFIGDAKEGEYVIAEIQVKMKLPGTRLDVWGDSVSVHCDHDKFTRLVFKQVR